ncbi:MAG: hypothetical protein JNG89_15725 [Planctomycetaceae bacterium]|nr:hypothetical protein [Planctomycetaceae bacterium]
MTEPHDADSFASRLLRQEDSLKPERYQEHRMQLEQQLARAERNVEITKWVVVAALLASVVGMYVAGSRVLGSPDPFDKDATALAVFFGALNIIGVIVLYLGLASYFSRFTPRVRRLREDLQNESIRELRRDVAELRQLLEKHNP